MRCESLSEGTQIAQSSYLGEIESKLIVYQTVLEDSVVDIVDKEVIATPSITVASDTTLGHTFGDASSQLHAHRILGK